MASMQGRVAIISGAARGMGAAHVQRFAEAGARIVALDVLEPTEKLAEGVAFLHGDVTQPEDWAKAIELAQSKFGAPTVLVNNAAVLHEALIGDLTLAEYRRVIEINQVGVFLGMKAVWPCMMASGGGSIVNISSVAGMRGGVGSWAYSSSKYAVRGLTQSGALEGGPHNIRVNSVHPGSTDTPMLHVFNPDDNTAFAATLPIARMAAPREISEAVLFLASDAASYVTGAEFVVDGGLLARMM